MRDPRRAVWVAVAAVTTSAAACLPRGAPPAGRQILADRQASLAAVVPPNGDGLLRILLTRPTPDGDGQAADLYVLSLDADDNPSPERLLISNIEALTGVGCRWDNTGCAFDAQGRVEVSGWGPQFTFGGTWVDPVTGEISGKSPNAIYSASRQRWFAEGGSVVANTGMLVDGGGNVTTIALVPPGTDPTRYTGGIFAFAGEDFLYVDARNELIDVPPSGAAQTIVTGILGFQAQPTPDGPLLTLFRATADPAVTQTSVRAPVTGHETVLPATPYGSLQFSDDGHWLIQAQTHYDAQMMFAGATYTLFDVRSGASQTLDLPPSAYPVWRPRHDEMWATSGGTSSTALLIQTPGGPTVTVDGVGLSSFSDDGNAWFTTQDGNETSTPALSVGWADDPTGPVFPYNPPSTYVEYQWTLPDGRLMGAFTEQDPQRADVIAVDPRTGDRRQLARRGMVLALGQTRFMGLFDYQGGRGDLTTVDFGTGQPTVLAPEFAVKAFPEPQGTDALAPGTRLVYQFQARTASPYDGLWVVRVP